MAKVSENEVLERLQSTMLLLDVFMREVTVDLALRSKDPVAWAAGFFEMLEGRIDNRETTPVAAAVGYANARIVLAELVRQRVASVKAGASKEIDVLVKQRRSRRSRPSEA